MPPAVTMPDPVMVSWHIISISPMASMMTPASSVDVAFIVSECICVSDCFVDLRNVL